MNIDELPEIKLLHAIDKNRVENVREIILEIALTSVEGTVIRLLQEENIGVETAKRALKDLSFAIQIDPKLAWAWHCNIAMIAQDAGATYKEASERAADFMRRAFGVDTSKPPVEQESYNVGTVRLAGGQSAPVKS